MRFWHLRGVFEDLLRGSLEEEHPGSGLKVKWYKRIGRDTESNMSMAMTQWYTIVLECLNSLKEDRDNGFTTR